MVLDGSIRFSFSVALVEGLMAFLLDIDRRSFLKE